MLDVADVGVQVQGFAVLPTLVAAVNRPVGRNQAQEAELTTHEFMQMIANQY